MFYVYVGERVRNLFNDRNGLSPSSLFRVGWIIYFFYNTCVTVIKFNYIYYYYLNSVNNFYNFYIENKIINHIIKLYLNKFRINLN